MTDKIKASMPAGVIEDERALRDQLELLSANAEREHRALIVDHEPSRLAEITNCLKLEGFMCVEAGSVSDGLERMEQYSDITMVLMVSDLPNHGAEEMVLKCKRYFPDRHYSNIVLTEAGSMDFMVKELGPDVFAFANLPMQKSQLVHLVSLARRVSDLYHYERSLKQFLIDEGGRRSRQVQRLKKEISDIDKKLGMGSEAQRRTQHVENLMQENEELRLRLKMTEGTNS